MSQKITIVVLVALATVGCATRKVPPPSAAVPPASPAPSPTPSSPPAVSAARTLESREGLASYYADKFQGRLTASGTTFDNRTLVAAHPSYPFGSLVRVTNLKNRRAVLVRIVDRGPAAAIQERGVIIDLSRAAATQLGFITAGRARVLVEVLRWGSS